MNDPIYRRILRFFDRVQLPDNHPLRRRFERWLLSHADDPLLDDELQHLWQQSLAGEHRAEAVSSGLHRSRRTILTAAAIAAMLLLSFGLGFLLSERHRATEAGGIIMLTATDRPGRFELPDGSVVWLNSHSALAYDDAFGQSRRQVTLQGEGFFEVQKDADRPFRVTTAAGLKVVVTGTAFDVKAPTDGAPVEVVLRSGAVNVSTAGNRLLHCLQPDERLVYNPRLKRTTVEHVAARHYCQWFEPQIVLSDQKLHDVIVNIERRYNRRILIDQSVDSAKHLTLTIADQPFPALIEILARILECDYTISANETILFDSTK